MLFVPLPLFATLLLILILGAMLRSVDMKVVANRLFATLVGLYAAQAGFLSLRWGYDHAWAGVVVAYLAPILPAFAYFAYRSLQNRLRATDLWPLFAVGVVWIVRVLAPEIVDSFIILTYLGFGGALIVAAWRGADTLALVRIADVFDVRRAMFVTGLCLIASAIVDVFVIIDFIQNGGANVGLIVSLVQTSVLIVVGLGAFLGFGSIVEPDLTPEPLAPTDSDDAIMAQLDALLSGQDLYQDTDLNLRRIARRLGLPDRSVSQAINRTKSISVSQYVNTFRINAACTMLRNTDQSVLQISLAAGFLSKSNFNREFGRIMGQTPSEWRRKAA